jgi:hypothetical protein
MGAMAQHADAEFARLEELRDSIAWRDDDGMFYGRAALEYGLQRSAMEAEWARSVIKDIDARGRQEKKRSKK